MENFSTMRQDRVRLDVHQLNALRVRKALLKGELANLAGVNSTSASRAMNGHYVGLRVARSIAAALEVPLRDLLFDAPTCENAPAAAVG